ncbi:hypothetical protein EVAR_60021_1 [Eumeta japonica]|uniref:Gustatory receptor n=1 Tax=Eumeta variegata TaxID=151549 RepID=A0A4C1ZHN3_EUMVA|nr:hypothetical protein EVAR_60021_1 [Eumeta japonica]
MVIIFCVTCERFYSRLADIKSKCTVALDVSPEECVSRKTIKNVLRLCDSRFSKMRVCGSFTADAGLPLQLVALITMYCIVLLQLAFL